MESRQLILLNLFAKASLTLTILSFALPGFAVPDRSAPRHSQDRLQNRQVSFVSDNDRDTRINPPKTERQESKVESRRNLDFSGMGRPGKQTAGESRDRCPDVSTSLTALMPQSNSGKTIAPRPTFLFYVPYSMQQTPVGEFVLQDEERNDIYRISFQLKGSSGYMPLKIPATAKPLMVNRWYRWYFKLYCEPNRFSSPIFVQGWIQRVVADRTLSEQLELKRVPSYLVYANNNIWYDAIAALAELRWNRSKSNFYEQDWYSFLKAKGVNLDLPSALTRMEMGQAIESK